MNLNITPVSIEHIADQDGTSFVLRQEFGGDSNLVVIDAIHVWLMAKACGLLVRKDPTEQSDPLGAGGEKGVRGLSKEDKAAVKAMESVHV
jgi:hypothetical protein